MRNSGLKLNEIASELGFSMACVTKACFDGDSILRRANDPLFIALCKAGEACGNDTRVICMYNRLIHAGIRCLDDLDEYTDEDLLSIWHIGAGSLAVIRYAQMEKGQDVIEKKRWKCLRCGKEYDPDSERSSVYWCPECDEKRRKPKEGNDAKA